jgi:hypothetical protein
MFLHAHNWGLRPADFWGMTFPEWFCLYEFYRGQETARPGGRMTKAEAEDLLAWTLSDGTS